MQMTKWLHLKILSWYWKYMLLMPSHVLDSSLCKMVDNTVVLSSQRPSTIVSGRRGAYHNKATMLLSYSCCWVSANFHERLRFEFLPTARPSKWYNWYFTCVTSSQSAHAHDARLFWSIRFLYATSDFMIHDLAWLVLYIPRLGLMLIYCILQVPRKMIGTDAFQETPIVEITRQITKHNYLVMDLDDLPRIVKEVSFLFL